MIVMKMIRKTADTIIMKNKVALKKKQRGSSINEDSDDNEVNENSRKKIGKLEGISILDYLLIVK